MKFGRLLLRGTIGALFIGHGTQKLFGAFGGYGLEATGEAFESMGLRPGLAQATIAGVTETGGGLGLLLGLQTPLAAAAVIGTMSTAIERVHFKNGPWVTKGGYEYNLVLIAAAAALAEAGPGEFSVDRLFGSKQSGPGWGLAALGLGVGGAVAAHVITDTFFPAEELPAVDEAPAPSPAADAPVAVPAVAKATTAAAASAPRASASAKPASAKPAAAAAKPRKSAGTAKPAATAKPATAAKPRAAAKKPASTATKKSAASNKSAAKAPLNAALDAADLIADR
jgi:putative oxidoreductase